MQIRCSDYAIGNCRIRFEEKSPEDDVLASGDTVNGGKACEYWSPDT